MAKKVTKKKTSTKKKATTRKRTTTPKAAKTVAALVPDERIRVRAFEIYSSGQNPSNPDADWHQAERELRT